MHFRAFLVLLLALAHVAQTAPVTLKEIEFLVRQQFSEEEIVREVAQRRLVAPLDDAGAAILTKSGATRSLLTRLRAPAMVVSPEESRSQLQRQLAREALAKKAAAEEPRAEAEPAENQSAPPTARVGGAPDTTRRLLEGKLVRLDGDQLKPFEAKELEKVRLYAFYYSAMWCGPCRKFTPELVAAYKTLKANYPQFEVVFVSSDRDEFNMGEYMRSHRMPWPAVRFGAADSEITKFAGSGIPWLVAVSDSGVPLTKNGVDKNYLPPTDVLKGIEYLLEKTARR